MKYLTSSLLLLSAIVGIRLLHGDSPAGGQAVPPAFHDRPVVSLLEGDYFMNTIDDASEGDQTYPLSTLARIEKSESGEWTLEISDTTPVVIEITVKETPRPLRGGILFQTINDQGSSFSTTIYRGSLHNPELITGRYYRVSTAGRDAVEGRFTLQKRPANQSRE